VAAFGPPLFFMASDFGIPPVVGDPAGMRALAAQLRAKAEQVTHGSVGIANAVSNMTFQGPAASSVRGDGTALVGRARSAAGDLGEIADLLDRAAGRVEHQQTERTRTIARLQHQADERERDR
jgi:hypothetical protein